MPSDQHAPQPKDDNVLRPDFHGPAAGDALAPSPRPLIIESKLRIPPRVGNAVERTRLLQRLPRDASARRVLISGPAGSGKTTLMADWCRLRRIDAAVVWLNLTERDTDLVRLWAHVIEGLSRALSTHFASAAAALAAGSSVRDVVIPSLANALVDLDDDLVLAFDDLHKLGPGEARDSILSITPDVGPRVTVATTGRVGPDADVRRLIAHGEAVHVDADDLRFDRGEARMLLERTSGAAISLDDVEAALEQTHGWIAALALSARHAPIGSAGLTLPQDTSGIDEYVYEEVRQGLSPPEVQGLATLAQIARFTRPLVADAVPEAVSLLGPERREEVGIRALGNGWFGVHDLIAQALLTHHGTPLSSERLAAVAAWLERHEDMEEAIELYARAGAWEAAADLLNRSWPGLVDAGRIKTLGRLLRLFPTEVSVSHERVLVTAAWFAGFTHDLAERDRLLDMLDGRASNGPLPDGSASLEHAAALNRALIPSDYGTLVAAAERAMELTRDDSPWMAFALMGKGTAGLASGDFVIAREAYLAAAGRSDALMRAATVGGAAMATWDLGEHDDAIRLAAEADRIRRESSLEHVPWLAFSDVIDGEVSLRDGDAPAAVSAFEIASDGFADLIEPYPLLRALLGLARARRANGDRPGAAEALARAEDRAARSGDIGPYYDSLLLDARRRLAERPIAHASPLDPLTDRELSVLRMLATTQLSQSEIADALFVSRNTIKTHIRAIYRKLRVTSRGRAALRARDLGLV